MSLQDRVRALRDELWDDIEASGAMPSKEVAIERDRIKVKLDALLAQPEEPGEARAYTILEGYGVSKERARSVANGIMVLATRYEKEIRALEQALTARPVEGEKK